MGVGLEFEEDDEKEVKRPKKLRLFDMTLGGPPNHIPIVSVSVGGMHTAAITTAGRVYTWGCGDDGALGRNGAEDVPGLVDLPERVTGVATGQGHSIFFNTENSTAYFCGVYRVRYSHF